MGEVTGISWCHATLNFWVGCTKVSTGDKGACEFCYAETWAMRWPAYRETWGVGATRVRFKDTRAKAMKLERLAVASGAPFYCFSNSLSDIFDNEVPIEWLAEAFADMRAAPHVTFLLLTKRAPNIQKRVEAAGALPPNAALGITVVTQEEADRDIPHLLVAAAHLKPVLTFLSMEPLMGAVDISWAISNRLDLAAGILRRGLFSPSLELLKRIRWVITGGESGNNARITHPAWRRSLRDQCAAAGVPFHDKQVGEWISTDEAISARLRLPEGSPYVVMGADGVTYEGALRSDDVFTKLGKKHTGRLLDGVLHDAMPGDAR